MKSVRLSLSLDGALEIVYCILIAFCSYLFSVAGLGLGLRDKVRVGVVVNYLSICRMLSFKYSGSETPFCPFPGRIAAVIVSLRSMLLFIPLGIVSTHSVVQSNRLPNPLAFAEIVVLLLVG